LDGVVQQMGQADPGEDSEGGRGGLFQIVDFRFQISDLDLDFQDFRFHFRLAIITDCGH
jgi:hypothetical protein